MRPGSTINLGRRALDLLLPLSAWLLAADPAPAQAPPAAVPLGTDPTTKYRFVERYAVGNEPAAPGALGTYQVGILDSRVTTIDQGGGAAPKRLEDKYQAVFSERAAGVNSLDDRTVTDVVRRYDRVRVVDSRMPPDYKPPTPPYLDGLTLWIRAGVPKKIFSLTAGRRLRIGEFEDASQQVFIPGFAYTLPDIDCRIGDEWPLTATGTFVLLGGLRPDSGTLTGKLVEIRNDPKGGGRTAVFKITGLLKLGPANSAVNAEVRFAFTPPDTPADPAKKAAEAVVEARGGITRVLLGQDTSEPLPSDDPKQRLRMVTHRDYQLQRNLKAEGPVLDLPAQAPQPTEENSWLTFDNPRAPFQFRFPQDLRRIPDDSSFVLQRGNEQEGLDQIILRALPKSDPLANPEAMRKARIDELGEEWELTPGAPGYLPEADWPKLRVYRWDAYIRPKDKTAKFQRTVLVLGYSLVSGLDQAFYCEAKSSREPLLPIRGEVESILHTLVVEPSRK